MRRAGLVGAKRQMKRILAVGGLGLALAAGTVPAQARTNGHRHKVGTGNGHRAGKAKGHKVGKGSGQTVVKAQGHKVG
jgi:hypothetical protein